ncbi:hypothetical protein FOH10_13575 [Nocardia otitidiscaviarum]|uniref:Lipoprotein n=1 Tax=Nocardia otitidiscaviarum TaxID=1823 RepID=A0A516NL02_9NOCA|nr:hypothetical protein [Nocardia otitidiscaviarum]QDP79582.1 hypothetical protein FOH10_13575 [Nocardia otitidiscaviarum]
MRRFLIAFAGLALFSGAAACSEDSTSDPTPSSTAPATTTSSVVASTTVPAQPTGERGADGSTGNGLSAEYCAKNQDPGCPLGSYVGPDAIPNPNGDGTWVPCEGTICTNPNHGAGPEATTPPPVEQTVTTEPATDRVEGAPCEGDGHWVHLEGGNAEHYGTDWLCRH